MFILYKFLSSLEKVELDHKLRAAISQGAGEWTRILKEKEVLVDEHYVNGYGMAFSQEVEFQKAVQKVKQEAAQQEAESLKRVFVAEKNGQPIELNEVHVEAVSTPKIANARREITPTPRLKSERMVPYVSIEIVESLVRRYGGTPELEAMIAGAWEGVKR